MAIGSTGRMRRRGRVTVDIPGIECAEALIGRKTVLLEAALEGVDFSNDLIQRAFAELAGATQDRPEE
jgi:hypothetical protein